MPAKTREESFSFREKASFPMTSFEPRSIFEIGALPASLSFCGAGVGFFRTRGERGFGERLATKFGVRKAVESFHAAGRRPFYPTDSSFMFREY
jgi:hypothetical protein